MVAYSGGKWSSKSTKFKPKYAAFFNSSSTTSGYIPLAQLSLQGAEHHPSYGMVLFSLANLYLDQERADDAAKCLERAQRIFDEAEDSKEQIYYPALIVAQARYFVAEKDYTKSNELFERALKLWNSSSDYPCIQNVDTTCYYSESLIAQAEYNRAREVIESALARAENCLGKEHVKIKELRQNLSTVADCEKR